jgi:hypothetical protein
MVLMVNRLKPEEIHKRIKKQERTLTIYKLVKDKEPDERPHETARKYLETT